MMGGVVLCASTQHNYKVVCCCQLPIYSNNNLIRAITASGFRESTKRNNIKKDERQHRQSQSTSYGSALRYDRSRTAAAQRVCSVFGARWQCQTIIGDARVLARAATEFELPDLQFSDCAACHPLVRSYVLLRLHGRVRRKQVGMSK